MSFFRILPLLVACLAKLESNPGSIRSGFRKAGIFPPNIGAVDYSKFPQGDASTAEQSQEVDEPTQVSGEQSQEQSQAAVLLQHEQGEEECASQQVEERESGEDMEKQAGGRRVEAGGNGRNAEQFEVAEGSGVITNKASVNLNLNFGVAERKRLFQVLRCGMLNTELEEQFDELYSEGYRTSNEVLFQAYCLFREKAEVDVPTATCDVLARFMPQWSNGPAAKRKNSILPKGKDRYNANGQAWQKKLADDAAKADAKRKRQEELRQEKQRRALERAEKEEEKQRQALARAEKKEEEEQRRAEKKEEDQRRRAEKEEEKQRRALVPTKKNRVSALASHGLSTTGKEVYRRDDSGT